MKRVLVVYGGAKNRGGIHSYLLNLFDGLKNDKDVSLELYSIGRWKLADDLENKKFKVKISDKKTWSFGNILDINCHVKESGCDLLVSQGMVANFYTRMASWRTGVPNLVIVHSDWRTDYQGIKKFIFWVSDRLLRKFTTKYIAVSEYLKNGIVKEGIPGDKIEVVYSGVGLQIKNLPELHSGKAGFKLKITSNEGVVIGSMGRLHPVKNYDNLIQACAQLNNKEWKLKIIGEGSERSKLEKLIKELGVSDKVQLLGQIEDPSEQLSQIDIYVQPSLSEGFGLATVEAMLAGLPVVVSPRGALPELVKDGETGIVARGVGADDIATAIGQLLNNKDSSEKIALAGQNSARERFGIDRWIREMKEVFMKEEE